MDIIFDKIRTEPAYAQRNTKKYFYLDTYFCFELRGKKYNPSSLRLDCVKEILRVQVLAKRHWQDKTNANTRTEYCYISRTDYFYGKDAFKVWDEVADMVKKDKPNQTIIKFNKCQY